MADGLSQVVSAGRQIDLPAASLLTVVKLGWVQQQLFHSQAEFPWLVLARTLVLALRWHVLQAAQHLGMAVAYSLSVQRVWQRLGVEQVLRSPDACPFLHGLAGCCLLVRLLGKTKGLNSASGSL